LNKNLQDVLSIPKDAGEILRTKLGLRGADVLRVSFIPGPGDLAGTFEHWYSGQHDPNVSTIAYSLMFYELMKRLNAQCQIISIQNSNKTPQRYQNKFVFEEIVPKNLEGRFTYFLSQYLFGRELVLKVNAFDPHIVITSTHNPPASWHRLSHGRTLLLTAHNSFWPMGRRYFSLKNHCKKALLKYRATALDGAICISHECARQVDELTGGEVPIEVACPQIVDRYPIEERSTVKNLLFLGRIEESKGVFLLLDVFEELAHDFPKLLLTIAGTGSAESRLDTQLLKSSFNARIKYVRGLNSEGVHSVISESDLLICPTMTSFNEGLATVGFEAAAHGIPSVISSVVPAAEILAESCTIFDADNGASLKEAIRFLINNPEKYRAKCAATSKVRDIIYDRSFSWGSALFRALTSVDAK
jgi:glycogen synthase